MSSVGVKYLDKVKLGHPYSTCTDKGSDQPIYYFNGYEVRKSKSVNLLIAARFVIGRSLFTELLARSHRRKLRLLRPTVQQTYASQFHGGAHVLL